LNPTYNFPKYNSSFLSPFFPIILRIWIYSAYPKQTCPNHETRGVDFLLSTSPCGAAEPVWQSVFCRPSRNQRKTKENVDKTCPFPIGWLINRGVCLPLYQQLNDDRWYTSSRPFYFYQKDIIACTVLWRFESKLMPTEGVICSDNVDTTNPFSPRSAAKVWPRI
jgi:hypothetical protein